MATNTPFDWTELIRSIIAGAGAFILWLGGKFVFNRWEKKRLEAEVKLKEAEADLEEHKADTEASGVVRVYSQVAQDTGQTNILLRTQLNDMLTRIFSLEKTAHSLEMLVDDLKTSISRKDEKITRLEARVKLLEDILRSNNISFPVNGNG